MTESVREREKEESALSVKEDARIDRGTLWILLAGIFLISLSLLIFEITLTRLLSVMLLYHYAFAVISLVLLGLGAGSIFVHFFRPRIPSGHNRFGPLTLFAGLFSLSIPLSVILMTGIAHTDNVLLYCLILFIPFFFAGALLAEVFRMFPAISARIYGADLVGAAVGSLGVVLALDILGGINTSFFAGFVASLAMLLFATRMLRKNIRGVVTPIISFVVVLGLLGSNLLGSYLPDAPIGINPAKGSYYPLSQQGNIIETRWSAFGRTDLVEQKDTPGSMIIFTDGAAGTLMYRFSGDFEDLDTEINNLKDNHPSYFPFLFLQEEERNNTLIIGPGGGLDILLASMGGVGEITAVEVNRDLVDIVREYSWYNGGVYTDLDNVDIVVEEGRNFLKRQEGKYDIIMLTFPTTMSSRSLEGYSLTENFLFTVDSIHDYLDHLTDEGRLVVSAHNRSEILRLLSISLSALDKRDISNEAALKQIYILGSPFITTFVLKKTPFEPTEAVSRYEAAMHRPAYQSTLSYFPYIDDEDAVFDAAIMALANREITLDDFEKAGKNQGYDISPVTDDSPFFYKLEEGIPQSVSQVFWSAIILMLLVVSVPPLYWRKRTSQKEARSKRKKSYVQKPLRSVVLFSMLGIGFMLVDISLIQRFVLFLGQPVLSLVVLLFSLLVGAGIGSICSGRLASERIVRGIAIAGLAIGAVVVGYTFLLPLIFNQLLGLGLTIRLIATIGILTPLGFIMGFPFPLGIRLLKEMEMENHIPWMWGINGIGSVLGSALTIVIAISLGFTEALLIGAGCYFIVFLIFRKTQYKKEVLLQKG